MTLAEIYFYMMMIISVVISLTILISSEDLKDTKRYKKYIKYAFITGSIGILMELLKWNYLCHFQCILIMFSPFLTIIITKGVAYIFQKMTSIEPHQMDKFGLSDGFWQRNKGNLTYKYYYILYSAFIIILPIGIIGILYAMLKENMCY